MIADLNNDGVDDVVIGASLADPGGREDAGETYIVFGPLLSGVYELSADADLTLSGTALDDALGAGLASGDVNDDGYADLIVGALLADIGGITDAGETYVIFGPLAGGPSESTTVPGLTPWGLIVLAVVMAAFLWTRRRTQAREGA